MKLRKYISVVIIVISLFLQQYTNTTIVNAQNYKDYFIIYSQFAIGYNDTLEYRSTLQITNHLFEDWQGRFTIHGTGATRWTGRYSINGHDFTGYTGNRINLKPSETLTLEFRGDRVIRSGFLKISGRGGLGRIEDISAAFFYRVEDRKTRELIDSVGVIPATYGWLFIIPLKLSESTDTGIAYAYLPLSDRTQLIYELWDKDGELYGVKYKIIEYAANTPIHPYHQALFVTEIFPDLPERFEGSIHIYSQRNIHLMVMRMDSLANGGIQLTSIPASGYYCQDSEGDCFKEQKSENSDVYLP